ncbi:MAG: thermonuclease family protein [Nanoarchaeota archaeon]
MHKSLALLFAFLLTTLIAINYLFFSSVKIEEKETVIVARVIDGDTLKLADGRTIRLLNINAPEKNMPSSHLAKEFLSAFENNSIQIEVTGTDKYQRSLARLYDSNYLNLALVEKGLSSKFLVVEDELLVFSQAEHQAIEEGKGIWEHSLWYGCFTTDIDKKKEIVSFMRKCPIPSMKGWSLKDESRKTYVFTVSPEERFILESGEGNDNKSSFFWKSKTEIWNNDRDTLYLFDEYNKIVHTQSYGYI